MSTPSLTPVIGNPNVSPTSPSVRDSGNVTESILKLLRSGMGPEQILAQNSHWKREEVVLAMDYAAAQPDGITLDPAFLEAATRLLEENAELYRRLA